MRTVVVLKSILLAVLAAYALACLLLFVFQKRLIYLPDGTEMSDCQANSERGGEVVTNGSFRGYLFKGSPDRLVVYYHGNGGRACGRIILHPALASSGASVLFVEYSGYSGEGTASKKGILQNVADAAEFVEAAGYREVIVAGESLGNGPAAYHAKLAKASMVVMITPYHDFAVVAGSQFPYLPVRFLLREDYLPGEWLSGYEGPVRLAIAGKDELVPPREGKRLYESLSTADKKAVVIEGAGHNSIFGFPELDAFLRESVAE